MAEGQAIDRAHLERMTAGDAALAGELLGLFAAQSEQLLRQMQAGAPAAVLAHTLKGAALGIGAHRVAEAADKLERDGAQSAAMPDLAAAVEEARAAIAHLLAPVPE